jgi:hypothetical protein
MRFLREQCRQGNGMIPGKVIGRTLDEKSDVATDKEKMESQ